MCSRRRGVRSKLRHRMSRVRKLEKDWTVLVYLDGRQGLATSCRKALGELREAGGSDAQVDVVVQQQLEPTLKERWQGIRSLEPVRGAVQADPSSPMTPAPKAGLGDFLAWGIQNYPARNYLVVVKTHGVGHESAADLRGQLEQAQKQTGRKIDVLALDACSMQQAEVAGEVRHLARIMVGSQEDIFATAFPYREMLTALKADSQASPDLVSKRLVNGNRAGDGLSSQSAVNLEKWEDLTEQLARLNESLVKVEPALIYTEMMRARSQEPDETLRPQYDFRDLGGFLEGVSGNQQFPEEARQRASAARQALAETVLASIATKGTARLKGPTGLSTVIPWNEARLGEEYPGLAFVRESKWDKVLHHVFHDAGQAHSHASESTTPLWKIPLKHYKKYVSGHLGVACPYDPSCSQFARQAIEKNGLLQGSWMGLIRLSSCNHHTHGGADPVPGVTGPPPQHSPVLLSPPPAAPLGPLKHLAVVGAGVVAAGLGGLAAGLAFLPAGAAAGAFFGFQVGADRMDDFTQAYWSRRLEEQHQRLQGVPDAENLAQNHATAAAQGMLGVARVTGGPALEIHDRALQWTGNSVVSKVVGASLGSVVGTVKGAATGLMAGMAAGARFGYLWGSGLAKEELGQLPPSPFVQEILKNDYEMTKG